MLCFLKRRISAQLVQIDNFLNRRLRSDVLAPNTQLVDKLRIGK